MSLYLVVSLFQLKLCCCLFSCRNRVRELFQLVCLCVCVCVCILQQFDRSKRHSRLAVFEVQATDLGGKNELLLACNHLCCRYYHFVQPFLTLAQQQANSQSVSQSAKRSQMSERTNKQMNNIHTHKLS